jgi:hypothetical protein
MNITMIEMAKEDAKKQYKLYWDQIKDKRTKEDEEIARAYKMLAKGYPVINILDVMREAGADEQGRPHLAIARADKQFVYYHHSKQYPPLFTTAPLDAWGDPTRLGAAFHKTKLSGLNWPSIGKHYNESWLKALIPIVPPQFRPKWKLSNYHILFEAEWDPVPPVDPILLKHIGGHLYAVLAQWDLTEVERAVIAKFLN